MKKDIIFTPIMLMVGILLFLLKATGMTSHIIISVAGFLVLVAPVSEEEYAFPKLEGLPDDTPLGKLKKDEVWFPGLEYLFGFRNLVFSDSVHYEF